MYQEMNRILWDRFPQLRTQLSQCMSEYECGPHVLYEVALNPYVKEVLEKDNNDEKCCQVFEFFEELATSGDEEVRNLLQVTLLEALWDEKELLHKACGYMKPETRRINDEIGTYFRFP